MTKKSATKDDDPFAAAEQPIDVVPLEYRILVQLLYDVASKQVRECAGEVMEPQLVFAHKLAPEEAVPFDGIIKQAVPPHLSEEVAAADKFAVKAFPIGPLFNEAMGTRGKDVVARLVNEALDQGLADAVVILSEAWTLRQTERQKTPTGSLADEPGRKEIVMFNLMTATKQYLCHAPIERPGNTLGKLVVMASDHNEGRFIRNRSAQ